MKGLIKLLKEKRREADLKKIERDWRKAWELMGEIKGKKRKNFRVNVTLSNYLELCGVRIAGIPADEDLQLTNREGAFYYYSKLAEKLSMARNEGYIPQGLLSERDPPYVRRFVKAA